MCRDLMLCRKPSVLKTSINIITTTATPTFRALRSRTSEGEDRGEGDKSPYRLPVILDRRARSPSLSPAGPVCVIKSRTRPGGLMTAVPSTAQEPIGRRIDGRLCRTIAVSYRTDRYRRRSHQELSYNVANGSCIALAAKPISRPNVITLNHNSSDSVPASLAEAGGDLPRSQSATVLIV